MNSVPPPPRTSVALAACAGLGAAGAYGLAHMPDNVPWWVSLSLGAVFTGIVAATFLYTHRPGDPS